MAIIARYTGIRPRGMAQAIKDGIDDALSYHRRENLPKHFTREARGLYPDAYRKPTQAHQPKVPLKDIIASMTPAQKAQWDLLRAHAADGAYRLARAIKAGVINPQPGVFARGSGKLPLVETGHLRDMILHGVARFSGSVATRRLSIEGPFYLNFQPKHSLNKVAALSAITAGEADDVARFMGVAIQTRIDAARSQTHDLTRAA